MADQHPEPPHLRSTDLDARDANERLQLALDSAGLGTWRWDIATGEVAWDERMEELFGFAPGSFDGTYEAYRAALHPDDRDQVLETVQRAVEARATYRVEHKVVLPDGSARWIQGSGKVIVGADGAVTGAIGCSMDVTDRVLARLAAEETAALAKEAADRERIDRERIEFLAAINQALADATTTRAISIAVTRTAVPRLGDWCSMYVLPEHGRIPDIETFHVEPALVEFARDLTARYPYDPDAPTGMPAVIRTGRPEFHPELTTQHLDRALAQAGFEDDDAAELSELFERSAIRSTISVPLMKRGRILGGLSFAATSERRAFTEQDLELAQVVAGRVASSLENRRLSDAQRLIASTLQASLLPREIPEVPGLDVAVRYWAAGEAMEVGGDFYDLFESGDGRWTAVIGDVCGKGAPAASLLALARHTIRQAVWRGDDSVQVLQWLNRAITASIGPSTSFLTTALVEVEASGAGFDLTVTCAGHPPPVVVRTDGSAEPLGVHGGLVGMLDEVKATPARGRLDPGDTLVLYTDGLTDVPPPHGLTTEQAVELIAEAARSGRSAQDVAASLEQGVERRLLLAERSDDIAVVILRPS